MIGSALRARAARCSSALGARSRRPSGRGAARRRASGRAAGAVDLVLGLVAGPAGSFTRRCIRVLADAAADASSASTPGARSCSAGSSTRTGRAPPGAPPRGAARDRQETLDIIVDAVEEVRAAAPEVDAVGLRHPGAGGLAERACRAGRPTSRSTDVPFRDLMSERLGLPVVVDNDANVALLAEHRHGRGARRAARVLLTLGTGHRRRASCSTGASTAARSGVGGRARPHGGGPRRRRLPGRLPRPRLPRGARVGHGDRARRARRGRGGDPDSPLGRRAGRGRRDHAAGWSPSSRTTATSSRAAVLAEVRPAARAPGSTSLVNVFDPEVVVIGGGAVAAGELLLGPAREVVAERRCPRSRERGADRARPLRRRGGHARGRAAGARGRAA